MLADAHSYTTAGPRLPKRVIINFSAILNFGKPSDLIVTPALGAIHIVPTLVALDHRERMTRSKTAFLQYLLDGHEVAEGVYKGRVR